MVNLKSAVLMLLAGCLSVLPSSAQTFSWRASVSPVNESGFYALPISAQLGAISGLGLNDVRIIDSITGKQVPYVVRRAGTKAIDRIFTDFPIIANSTDSQYTVIDVLNPTTVGVSNLWIVLRNTAVERFAAVSGSDDGKNWYIIDDYVLFHRSYVSTAGSYSQSIDFPQTTYRYYRLKINNEKTDRLNVEKVGRYSNISRAAQLEYITNPTAELLQKDSINGRTYVSIALDAPYVVNRLELSVNGPRFFKRSVNVYVSNTVKDTEQNFYQVANYQISQPNTVLNIPESKVGSLMLEITNNDDPPLKVTNVTSYSTSRQLVAWLEKGNAYNLYVGNDSLQSPVYDLSQFTDSIPVLLPIATIHTPIKILQSAPPIKNTSSTIWIWITVVVISLLMAILTYRLMKDVKAKKV